MRVPVALVIRSMLMVVVISLGVFLQTPPVSAGSLGDYAQELIDYEILPAVLRNMTGREREKAENITVNVVDKPHIRVRALGKRVEISENFLKVTVRLMDGSFLASAFGKVDKIAPYQQYASEFVKNFKKNHRAGRRTLPKPFFQFAGIPEREFRRVIFSPQYKRTRRQALLEFLSYVVTHELGHHVLGHLKKKDGASRAKLRKMEDEADDFAMRINWVGLGNSPISMLPYFMVFTLAEGGLDRHSADADHSASACRMEKFLRGTVHFFKGHGPMQQEMSRRVPNFDQQIAKIRKAHRWVERKCRQGGAMATTSVPGLW